MIKVLAIGNSFSIDARAFTAQIAAAAGIEIVFGNLHVRGCSLEQHWINASQELAVYEFSKSGSESRQASIRDALRDDCWDFVTMQQASRFRGKPETYQPYLNELSAYVKALAPRAEQLLHETWAYELDSENPAFKDYGCSQMQMYAQIRSAYYKAAKDIGARLIPTGDAFQIARKNRLFDYAHGGRSLNRDGFHAGLTHGRYLIGCVWAETLSGVSMVGNGFIPRLEEHPELTPTSEELTVLQQAAHEAVAAQAARS